MPPASKAPGRRAQLYHNVVDMACGVLACSCCRDASATVPESAADHSAVTTDAVPSLGSPTTSQLPARPFKRSTSGTKDLKKDIAILSTVYLFQDHPTLKSLAALIVSRIRGQDDGDSMFAKILLKCADFTVRLAAYAEEDADQSHSAIVEFTKTMDTLGSVDPEESDSLKEFERRVDSVAQQLTPTTELQARTNGGEWATLLLDWGSTIFGILKEASEVLPVPALKPVFASLAALFDAAQRTQANFGQMGLLSFIAADLAIQLAEQCSCLNQLPQETTKSIDRFERFVNSTEQLEELETQLNAAVVAFQNNQLVQLQANYQYLKDATAQGRLDHLPQHPDDSGQRGEYLEDSRTEATNAVAEWMRVSHDLIIWIHGTAGVGKSTFSRHLTESLRQTQRLAASVRLRAVGDNWGPETMIKLLAAELGRNHPMAIDDVLAAVGECNDRPLRYYVERCIRDPVRSLRYGHPLIILMDGVDEWPFHEALIKELAHLRTSPTSSFVKFIFTSRSDPHRSHFPNIPIHSYPLPPVPPEVVVHPNEITQLAVLSGGLLIWASTVCGLVKHSLSSNGSARVVNNILTSETKLGGSRKLMHLYRDAIIHAFPSPVEQRRFRDYLGSSMVLQEPLDVFDFSKLTGIEVDVIKRLQTQIAAICQLPSKAVSLSTIYPAASIFHLSFLEFVQDLSANTEALSITLSLVDFHARLGQACLEATFVSPPPEQTVRSFPRRHTNAYRYAVKFWPLHISNGTDRATWSETSHCKKLQDVQIEGMRRWARDFVEYSQPQIHLDKQSFVDDHQGTVLHTVAGGLAGVNSVRSAVDCLEIAVRLRPTSIPSWHQLGEGFRRLSADVWDSDRRILDKAAEALQNALTIWEAYSASSPSNLPSIARAAPKQRPFPHDIPDLEDLVSLPREELGLQSEIYESYPRLVSALGSVLQAQFEQGSTIDDGAGHEAIRLYSHALEVPLGDQSESRCALLYNIASVYYTFHARTGEEIHLCKAIEFGERALKECPPNDTAHSLILRALGKFYRVSGSIQEAIEMLEKALNHCHDQEDKYIVLNEYSDALRARFEHVAGPVSGEPFQNLIDLDGAISLRKEALGLCPQSHPSRSEILYRLGNDLYRRSQYNTSFNLPNQRESALHESIRFYEEALELRIARDGHRFATLTQLSVSLLDHAKEEGGRVDEIISLLSEALSFEEGITIPSLERATCRETLAQALYLRWMKTAQADPSSSEQDLRQAISLQHHILDIDSLDPPIYTNSLFNLAAMRGSLYSKLKLPEDQIESLFHKAYALLTRFEYAGSASDLDEVIQICGQLLEKLPPGHLLVDECKRLSESAAQTASAIQLDALQPTLGTIYE
ncbi:hypothetical protein EST38_g4164 [Candolleomyces aberdarensis]|uniref:Nephrocystin 3-like N-terminal domain-containing protein n=1 Tax=Candolleomyces aberdarensis TaxID=2316362 RepID=A0A4Q2DN88_9AGAR|nr:hypothetical protein EST38_g4164 [Candolleomyces aberdarensis]